MPAPRSYSTEYSLFPRVVPLGWSGGLVPGGEYRHTRFQTGVEYSYELQSTFYDASGPRLRAPLSGSVSADEEGCLAIPWEPDVPGEWQLTVDAEEVRSRNLPCGLGLFAQDPEWFRYRPYLGVLHAHSTGSDGGQEPAYVPVPTTQAW